MVNFNSIASTLATTLLFSTAVAHPGEHHDREEIAREIAIRTKLAASAKRQLAQCSSSVSARALHQRSVERRAAKALRLRTERGISGATKMKHRRDLAELQAYELISHNATSTGYTLDTDPSVIFSANTTYALTPNNTIGPYYVEGEYIRTELTEGQSGVPMHLELQFVDITTCDPVSELLIDIWSCNATGIYSGIDASSGQGGLNSTFLRGVQTTDDEGVVQFDTLFPGHYTDRATHEHVVSHINGTVLPNGTYTGGTVNHIGQLFFDESLKSQVEALAPYNTNTQAYTSNDDDMWAPSGADADYDPFPEYVMLGDALSDGLLVYITIGINTTRDLASEVSVAAHLYETGGVTEASSIGGAPATGGNAGGNMSAPGMVKRSEGSSVGVFGFLLLTCTLAAGGSWLLG